MEDKSTENQRTLVLLFTGLLVRFFKIWNFQLGWGVWPFLDPGL